MDRQQTSESSNSPWKLIFTAPSSDGTHCWKPGEKGHWPFTLLIDLLYWSKTLNHLLLSVAEKKTVKMGRMKQVNIYRLFLRMSYRRPMIQQCGWAHYYPGLEGRCSWVGTGEANVAQSQLVFVKHKNCRQRSATNKRKYKITNAYQEMVQNSPRVGTTSLVLLLHCAKTIHQYIHRPKIIHEQYDNK